MTTTNNPGVAGRTNYRQWDKMASDLVASVDVEEQQEKEESAKALGLDGKYAHSEAEAEERKKAKDVKKAKRVLEQYKRREGQVMQLFSGLLGPDQRSAEEEKAKDATIVRLTRDRIEAGKRVVTLCDTSGASHKDTIILTQDLSHLESKMAHKAVAPKEHDDGDADHEPEAAPPRTVFGLIKLFLSNVHNCTIVIKCKLISGTVELNHCTNVILRIEKDATVATLQADLCDDISIEFRDAPSGKNTGMPGQPTLYWGDDKNDRIFHAGVKNMKIALLRDGFVESQVVADYLKDGATAVGNAAAEECQFVTSVIDGELITERVVRHGATTGKNARAMTQRELDAERERRESAVDMAMEKAIQFREVNQEGKTAESMNSVVEKEDDIEELYTSMSKSEINDILAECEGNKARGNEAFAAGEYAQAILLYSLSLDKADELPDKGSDRQLFPRHIVLSNRSACFLKMGEHEKALSDATRAQGLDPTYVKAPFRKGLALHAMGRYNEAIEVLAEAHKLEPKNNQIKQALQFSEVRLTMEMRKRMEQT